MMYKFFCPVWDWACLFAAGFLFMSAPYSDGAGFSLLRAPGSSNKVLKSQFLAFTCFLCIFLSPMVGCGEPCCIKYFNDGHKLVRETTPLEWLKFASPLVLGASGVLTAVVWDWVKYGKARQAMHSLLSDCLLDGSLRVVYEKKRWLFPEDSPWEWSKHELRKGDYDLQRLAGQAVKGKKLDIVYIVFDIPGEKLFTLLIKYNIVTRDDITRKKYGFRPLSEFDSPETLPRGCAVLQLYYHAEYVRVWG